MSVETITTVISAAALLLSFFGAFGWMIRRMDAMEVRLEQRLGARIDGGDEKLSTRIDTLDEKLTARIDGVERELVEVKISVARLEGPPRHLLPAR
ncbi:MAG TPA: hypothetical protein VNQ48_07775 [Microbacteriaceae bacterium]|nr:hypothetical protein [Microbacteriaceae bacterium]